MDLWIILLIVLIVLLIASVPAYPYSREWGYFPTGIIAALLVVFVILLFTGVLDFGDGNGNGNGIDIEITPGNGPDNGVGNGLGNGGNGS